MGYKFERDSACRGYWVNGLKNFERDIKKSHGSTFEGEFFIPDSLIKSFCKLRGCPRFPTWKEQAVYEIKEQSKQLQLQKDVNSYKIELRGKIPIVSISDPVAKVIAVSELLAEEDMEARNGSQNA